MEDSVLQRIREVFRIKGVSMLQVSNACGIKQNTFSRQVSGESTLSVATLLSIIGYFPDISTEWLLRGDGEMIKENNDNKEMPQSFDAKVEIDEEGCLKIKIKK